MNWLLNRLREPSTWRGLVWLATGFGVTLKPEVWEQVTAVGMALAGLIGVLTRDDPKTVQLQLPPIDLVGKPEGDDAAGAGAVPVSDAAVPAAGRDSLHPAEYIPRMRVVRPAEMPAERGRGPGPADGNPPAGWNG